MVGVHEYVRVWMCVCVYLCMLVLIRNLSVSECVFTCVCVCVCVPVLRCPDFYPLLVGMPPAGLYLLLLSSQ